MTGMMTWARRLLENQNMLCAVAIVVLWSVLAYKDIDTYIEVVGDTTNNAKNIALAVEQHVDAVLSGADEDLKYARDSYFLGEKDAQVAYQHLKSTHSSFERFTVINSEGIMIMSSFLTKLPTQSFSERDYFKALKNSTADIPYVSKNLKSFLSGKEIFLLARALRDDRGKFLGVVTMSFDPQVMSGIAANIDLGDKGLIALVGFDGFERFRIVSGQEKEVAEAAGILDKLRGNDTGWVYSKNCPIDGTARYIAWKRVGSFPLAVTVGIAKDAALSEFWRTVMYDVIVALCLSIAMLLFSNALRAKQQNLVRAIELAEEGNRAKSEFIANMSHEIRTPLNAIVGFTQIMVERKEYSDKFANHVLSASRHLLELVTNVIEMARATSGSLRLSCEKVLLKDVVQECSDISALIREDKNISFDACVSSDLTCMADRVYLKLALINIITNAVKFTPIGGSIKITATQSDEGKVNIAVSDSGIGMSSDDIKIALTPFGQVSNGNSKEYGGAGLGLPLTKRIIEAQGGMLSIRSEIGNGTVVMVRLPG